MKFRATFVICRGAVVFPFLPRACWRISHVVQLKCVIFAFWKYDYGLYCRAPPQSTSIALEANTSTREQSRTPRTFNHLEIVICNRGVTTRKMCCSCTHTRTLTPMSRQCHSHLQKGRGKTHLLDYCVSNTLAITFLAHASLLC